MALLGFLLPPVAVSAAGTASQLANLYCPTGGTADAFPGGHHRAATQDRSRKRHDKGLTLPQGQGLSMAA
jgi:hypothetical protein